MWLPSDSGGIQCQFDLIEMPTWIPFDSSSSIGFKFDLIGFKHDSNKAQLSDVLLILIYWRADSCTTQMRKVDASPTLWHKSVYGQVVWHRATSCQLSSVDGKGLPNAFACPTSLTPRVFIRLHRGGYSWGCNLLQVVLHPTAWNYIYSCPSDDHQVRGTITGKGTKEWIEEEMVADWGKKGMAIGALHSMALRSWLRNWSYD